MFSQAVYKGDIAGALKTRSVRIRKGAEASRRLMPVPHAST